MKLFFEYGKQKFTAELSDNERNAELAISLAWDLVNKDTKLLFMPDFSAESEKLKKLFRKDTSNE